MESPLRNELEKLSVLVETLAAQRNEARRELKAAREALEDLRRELSLAKEGIHKRDLDIEYLTLSHKLADTPQALAEARATVRRMIAGVERAMALLRDDAGA